MESHEMTVGPWAGEELGCRRKYLPAYATILRKRRFRFAYIDAFAAPGSVKLRQFHQRIGTQGDLLKVAELVEVGLGYDQSMSGSTRVALEAEPMFSRYVFVEMDRERVAQLERLKSATWFGTFFMDRVTGMTAHSWGSNRTPT